MKALALGLAVVGAATFGFAGTVSANHDMMDPAFVSDVTIGCNDMGYAMSTCAELVGDTWTSAILGEVAASVASLGVTLDLGN